MMKSGKTIDISKSSLVSLKAELARKQEEVKEAKESQSYIKLPPKPKEAVKVNPGVEERNKSDLDLLPEEVDLLKKSREVLEVKSKLYDELQKGNVVSEEGKSQYLVDFKQKDVPSTSESLLISGKKIDSDSEDDDNLGSEELDKSEWVEYTDCLGRTRTCHYSELAEMKEKDRKMAKEVRAEKPEQREEPSIERPPELLSSDMEREVFRKKWEEEERELLNKKDIHYEDILFDEARAHGVGYFKFSRDEEERRKEQEMMKKVREETETRQKEVRLLRARRENQRQARLIAARQRQRARLGLPPLTEAEILEGMKTEQEAEKADAGEEEAPVEGPSVIPSLEESLKRTAHVRPWDVGKTDKEVMSQDEWVEKQRNERKSEFAPSYTQGVAEGFDPSRSPPQIKKIKLQQSVPDVASSSEAAIEAGLRYFREQAEKKVKQKQSE